MTSSSDGRSPFIEYLESLAQQQDRGALAALRRGLGEEPGLAVEMHRYVAPWLPDEQWTWRNRCHYIVAALFALHPSPAQQGNFGDTFRVVASRSPSDDSIERRFMALLKCHRDDLFDHLRHAVGLARGSEAPVNWDRLLRDLRSWQADDRWVQRGWAQSFWGQPQTSGQAEQSTEQGDEA